MKETKPPVAAFLEAALEAAEEGAKILLNGFGRVMKIIRKGSDDPVTNFDLAAEKAVRNSIRKSFPDHGILAEEGGVDGPLSSKFRWYVDPLDGTVNFTRGRPDFAVSVACALVDPPKPPEVLAGVVAAPVLKAIWWARAGHGAHLSYSLGARKLKRKLAASSVKDIAASLVVTGFPYGFHDDPDPVLKPVGQVARKVGTMRQSGSAALDLCAVASGSSDAFFEPGLKPWDVAAGFLFVKEAGGIVSDWSGNPYSIEGSERLLASAPGIREELLSVLSSQK